LAASQHATGKPEELLPRGPVQPWPIHLLGRVIDWGLVCAAGVMIALVFFNVCTHAAGFDLAQTTETCELLMVWVTFLGGASITRRSGQMVITEFIDKLDGRSRLIADFVVQVFALVVLGILFWFGLAIVGNNWGNYLVVLNIPMAYQYMPLPIGSGAAMIFVAYDLSQILRGKSREERYGVDE
jgi:TRAP-type C4-dicarboxylate transport system permease small subunit